MGVREREGREEGNSPKEQTDLCNNVLAALLQRPYVGGAGTSFTNMSGSKVNTNRRTDSARRPFHLEAQTCTETFINLSGI